ncbi:MAG TPA: hypothetical protein VEL76_20810 [Gemmataceae bacterium]|nr:hypothetical protein [Gemmataceae bacterium]
MRSHSLRLVLAGLVGLVLLAACARLGYLAVVPRNGFGASRLWAELREQLPPGSPREAVERWCAARGFWSGDIHSQDGRKVGYCTRLFDSSWVERLLDVPAYLDIEVHFDRNDRLEATSIQREETWP